MQDHFRSLREHLVDIRSLVRSVESKNDAPSSELGHRSLKVEVATSPGILVELDAIDAVLTDDPAPEGVIRVEHEDLLRAADERPQVLRVLEREARQRRARVRHLRQREHALVEEGLAALFERELVRIDDEHLVPRPRCVLYSRVQQRDARDLPARRDGVVQAKRGKAGTRERMDQRGRLRPRPQRIKGSDDGPLG